MISQNQYITVTSEAKNPTLGTCDLEITMVKNNEFYFNSDGIYIDIVDSSGNSLLDKHIKWTPPKHNEAEAELPIDNVDETLYNKSRVDLIKTIDLLHADVDNRIYFSYVTIKVYYNYVSVTGSRQTLFEQSLRLESVVLPLPRLHEFNAVISSNYTQQELDEDLLKVNLIYKAVLPHYLASSFYTLELTADYSPGVSLFKTNLESAGSIEYEVPVLARGEVITFTLRIYKETDDGRKKIYVEATETLQLPRAKFQTLFVKNNGVLVNVKALYVKVVVGYNSLNQPQYAFVNVRDTFVKQGGLWYTG